MKKLRFHHVAALIILFAVLQSTGCMQSVSSDDAKGGTFTASSGNGSGSNSNNIDPQDDPAKVTLNAPTDVTATAVNGTPGQTSIPTTTRKFLHLEWSNSETSASTLIEVKTSADTVLKTVSGDTTSIDIDIGYLATDTNYKIRIRNKKSDQLSPYCDTVEANVTSSKLASPTALQVEDTSEGNYKFSWNEIVYSSGEIVGYEIKARLQYSSTTSDTFITPTGSLSNYYYLDPCGGNSNVQAVYVSIRAIGKTGVVSSDFMPETQLSCPSYPPPQQQQ